jgi:hypothetical protein
MAVSEQRASANVALPSANAPEPATTAPSLPGGTPCGPLECLKFPDAAAALRALLTLKPKLLALGEAHALAGAANVKTATERFETELLPLLAAAGASKLLLELVEPPRKCEAETAAVKQVQKPVVEAHQPENQDRFIRLGNAANKLGVVPFVLEATCGEFAEVRRAGADGIAALLTLIARKSEVLLRKMVNSGGPEAWYVAYGGALHNDVAPDDPFAFGSALNAFTGGRYIGLDLIVPEYISNTPVWQALPWYPHFDATAAHRDVTLFKVGPESFVLVFATTPVPSGAP